MNKIILLSVLVWSFVAAAHDATDWRLDKKAYQYTQNFISPQGIPLNPGPMPELSINIDELRAKLREFSGDVPFVLNGQEVLLAERGSVDGRNRARAFLAQEYKALGFQVSEQKYKSGLYEGANFVAEKVGKDPSKIVILSSHIDSVGNAGADDNGAGTISVWAIAKALAQKETAYTLRVVGFDQEEKGLVGSVQYVKSLQQSGEIKNILVDINVEMMGYDADNDGAFHVMDCDRKDSAVYSAELVRAVQALSIPVKKVAACTERSDHASFWRANTPAIIISQNFFGGDDNPCYHKQCDTVQQVNFQYMWNLTRMVGAGAASILGVAP